MNFRLKAFGLHLAASVTVLSVVLLALFLGWYRWPGWYVTGVLRIVAIMVGVDAALGPTLTLLIANPRKPRRELARDIGVIVAVQLVAFVYGTTTLWQGRPLYYTYSEGVLEVVQASALHPEEIERGRHENAALAPYWYSRPRWIYAPLPDDPDTRAKIMTSAVVDGEDVIDMPRYFQPWERGLPALRAHLRKIDELSLFSRKEQAAFKERVAALGYAADQAIALSMSGRDEARLLVVFDPATLEIKAMLRPEAAARR
jgi:hypothetical protein